MTISEAERKVEVTRQVLVENKDFDPLRAFKRLLISGDSLNASKINQRSNDSSIDSKLISNNVVRPEHLRRFFIDVRKENVPCDNDINQLFTNLDKLKCGFLNFQ